MRRPPPLRWRKRKKKVVWMAWGKDGIIVCRVRGSLFLVAEHAKLVGLKNPFGFYGYRLIKP